MLDAIFATISSQNNKRIFIMISNLLLLASAIYIYVDAIRNTLTLKGFISSKILHLCFYSLGHQFCMQLQEPGLRLFTIDIKIPVIPDRK